MQGVSIIVGVKRRPTVKPALALAEVWHAESWGTRAVKYSQLWGRQLASGWTQIEPQAPRHFFIPWNYALEAIYERGFAVDKLMRVNSLGIVTARDALTLDDSRDALWGRITDFAASEAEFLREKYSLGKDVRDWAVAFAKADVAANFNVDRLRQISYRPFDEPWTFYTGNSKGFHCYPRHEVMRNYLSGPNIGFLISKAHHDAEFAHSFVTNKPSEAIFLSGTTGSNAMNVPLYLYPEPGGLDTERRVNFDPKIYAAIRAAAGLAGADGDELRVFDYIYGVLHSLDYRATYAQFLKIDFPRIPYPASPEVFAHVADKGGQLRRLHLMEDAAIGDTPYPFLGNGDGEVVKPEFVADKVRINPDQWFADVPEIAWNFHIGGYQPAQKWLKDRKGRALSFDDVRHYQKIIKILVETDRIMKEIVLPMP
jgi:hypothetical protein